MSWNVESNTVWMYQSDITNCQRLTLLRCMMMELHQKLNMLKPTDNLFSFMQLTLLESIQKILETFPDRLILVERIRSKVVALNSRSALCSCLSPHKLVLVPVRHGL